MYLPSHFREERLDAAARVHRAPPARRAGRRRRTADSPPITCRCCSRAARARRARCAATWHAPIQLWKSIARRIGGAGDLRRRQRLRLAVLVRRKGADRQGRADLELRGRPRARTDRVFRRRDPTARTRVGAHRSSRAAATDHPGPSTTRRSLTCRRSCARSLASKSTILDVVGKFKASQNRSEADRAGVRDALQPSHATGVDELIRPPR